MINFESVGWSRISIDDRDLDGVVTNQLQAAGVSIQPYDLTPLIERFTAFLKQPAYCGEYQSYGGPEAHCLLEKALEHFISIELIAPQPGEVGIDVGSCRSVLPEILRGRFDCRCYEQDLEYSPGVHGNKIGGSADSIPFPDSSVDFMTLHCTFEHFEGDSDSGFVAECGRLLRSGGRVVILPLYLNANFCNVTGEVDSVRRGKIVFDSDAQHHCLIPEWANRFGRHYSPSALVARVLEPAIKHGLKSEIFRVRNWQAIHPLLWLRWIGVFSATR